jgi:hypothetical protein
MGGFSDGGGNARARLSSSRANFSRPASPGAFIWLSDDHRKRNATPSSSRAASAPIPAGRAHTLCRA